MLPSYDDICLPLLAEIHVRGGQSKPRDKNRHGQTIYAALANYFSLTQTDLSRKVLEDDGTARSKWENMVRWARNDLKKKGLLLAPSHGVWAIGDKGLSHLNCKRPTLDSPYKT
jgi:restriction endonuclease Mrr